MMTMSDQTHAPVASQQPEPHGIGGWLILPIIGLVLTILITAYNLLSGIASLQGDVAETLRTQFRDVLLLMYISTALGVICIGLAIYCLKLIKDHDRRTPRTMTVFYVVVVGMTIFEAYALSYMAGQFQDPSLTDGMARDVIRSIVACAIWIPYFHVSKRVKNTFVR